MAQGSFPYGFGSPVRDMGQMSQALQANFLKGATKDWVTSQDGLLIPKSLIDAKGDLIAGTADNTAARKAVGTNGQVLEADSTQSDGLAWKAPYVPRWSTAEERSGWLNGGVGNNQYNLYGNGAAPNGTNLFGASRFPLFYIDESQYAVTGRTTQWRIAATYASNGVLPGVGTMYFGIGQLSGLGGGATNNVQFSLTRNAAQETTISAALNSWNASTTAALTGLPQGTSIYGLYWLTSMNAGTTAATWSAGVSVELQYRHV